MKGLVFAVLLASAPLAAAQKLADPMRPPRAGAEAAQADAPSGRVHTILLSPGRKLAVIDGETVPLGGRIGGATLVRLSPTEAVLREGSEERVLSLFPGIDKKTNSMARAAQGGNR